MNYLAKISAHGLKSGDFSHDLQRVNLIIGPSASGKTSRLDAIRLALNGGTLLGRAADLKSRTIDIMDLARNGHIEVEAVDNDGRKVARRWMRGKNCVTLVNQLPPTPDILMDSAQYFALSDAKKIEYAFSLMTLPDCFSREAIMAELRNVRLDDNTEATERALNDILGFARELEAPTVQAWLGDLIATLKVRISNAKARAERMASVVQGITALANDPPTNPEADLHGARKNLEQLRSGLEWLERQKKEVADMIERREAIQREILLLQDDPAKVAETKAKIAELEADIERMENSPLALPSEFAGLDAEAIHAEMTSLANEVKAHSSKIPELCVERGMLLRLIDSLETEIQNFQRESKRLADDFEAAMQCESCPRCGSAPEHWGHHYSKENFQRNYEVQKANRVPLLEALVSKLDATKATLKMVEEKVSEAQDIDLKIEQKRLRSNQLFATLNNLTRAQASARTERENIVRSKRSQISGARESLESLSTVASRRATAEARLSELSLDGKPSISGIEKEMAEFRAKIEQGEARVKELESRYKAFIQFKADEARNAQAILEQRSARASLEMLKATLAKMERVQSEMVERAFDNILKTVNRITDGVIKEPIQYREGEIGRWVGATWIKHEAFSGTEKALTYAGISLALAVDAPIKLIMVDELGRLDLNSLLSFLLRIETLVDDGIIGQFVGALSAESDFKISGTGWNVIRI